MRRCGVWAILLVTAGGVGGCAAGSISQLDAEGQQQEFTIALDSEAATDRLAAKARECTDGMGRVPHPMSNSEGASIKASFDTQTRTGTITSWNKGDFGVNYHFISRMKPGPNGTTIVTTNIPKNYSTRWFVKIERWTKTPETACSDLLGLE